MGKLIGREKEIATLEKALKSEEAEMVAVIGRRRIGKTFLIKSFFKEKIVFEMTGVQDAPLNEQLRNFSFQLRLFSPDIIAPTAPKDWQSAFFMLIEFLRRLDLAEKKVIFFDELPWLATAKGGFLRALSYFWNSWAVNHNLIVVICGSAASWMINQVVNHTGGLHNRITRRIYLQPFNLAETEAFLLSKNVHLDRYHLVQLYMAMGGVPHYLKEVEAGKSAIQNIDQICFSRNGILRDEFPKLYASLFKQADNHKRIVRALAKKRSGMTRNELIIESKLSDGGSLQRAIEELEQSGFISIYPSWGNKKKNRLYRLVDEYSLFYLQFIEGKHFTNANRWEKLSQSQAFVSWSGYAFEGICLKHISQIKKALGISGIYAEASTFFKKGTEDQKGVQIDLLLDRNDRVINLFEVKFYKGPFVMSKEYAEKLREKLSLFQAFSKTRKQVFYSMVSTFGLSENKHSQSLIYHDLTLNDLFVT